MARDTKKMYEQRKEKYHQRKENGLCPKCGKQTDGIHIMCEECRREQRERYHWYSEHGICPKCQGDVAPGKKLCAVCLARKAENDKRRYDNLTGDAYIAYHKKANERSAETRRQKKEQGICRECSKPVFDGHSLCLDCLLKKRKRDRERGRKYDYKDPNGCYRCGAPCVPGKKLCPEHYKINLANIKKVTESEAFKLSQEKQWKKVHAMWEEIKWEKY